MGTTAFGLKIPLLIHNISDPDYEIKHNNWINKKDGGFEKISGLFSKKQAYGLGNSYKN